MSFGNGKVGISTGLTTLFDQSAADGKITHEEGNQIANMMGMNQDEFWSKFDLNGNHLMTGDELQTTGNNVASKYGSDIKYQPPGK